GVANGRARRRTARAHRAAIARDGDVLERTAGRRRERDGNLAVAVGDAAVARRAERAAAVRVARLTEAHLRVLSGHAAIEQRGGDRRALAGLDIRRARAQDDLRGLPDRDVLRLRDRRAGRLLEGERMLARRGGGGDVEWQAERATHAGGRGR